MVKPFLRYLRRHAIGGYCSDAFPEWLITIKDEPTGVRVELRRRLASVHPEVSLLLRDSDDDTTVGDLLDAFRTVVNEKEKAPLDKKGSTSEHEGVKGGD